MNFAIEVTAQNKQNNASLFQHKEVGDIAIFRGIPKTYKPNGELCINYHLLTERHISDGFLPVVEPEYDSNTEKLTNNLTKTGDTYVYSKVALTDEEIFIRQYPNQKLTQLEFRTLLETEIGVFESEIDVIIENIPDEVLKRSINRKWNHAEYFYLKDDELYILLPAINELKGYSLTEKDIHEMFQIDIDE